MPADSDGASIQMLNPNTGRVTDLLDYLVPGFRAFIVAPGDLNQLNPLYPRRGDQPLQAMAHKFVGVSRFWCGVGCLDHASLLANAVFVYSIGGDISWQEGGSKFHAQMHISHGGVFSAGMKKPARSGLCLNAWSQSYLPEEAHRASVQ